MPISSSLRALEQLTPQQLLDRASRTLPQILTVLLVVAIAWQLVQLTWMLLDRQEPVAIPLPAPAVGTAAVAARGNDVQKIADASLFGQEEAAAPVDPASAAPTQMNLVLSAVFATNDPAKGLAIIGESAAAANVFSVGEAVRPGTKLHAVYPDRVILDRGGNLEALALPTQSLAGLQMSRPATPPRAQSQFQENLRRVAESNPGAFAEVVRPQPVFANGVQRGYRVYPGRNRQQFARLGLQPGDLVLAINGTALDDPQRGMEIFNTMGSSDRVTVTVERNGQSQDLSLNTAQMMLPDAAAPQAAPTNRGIPPPPINQNGGPESQ
ncbi:MAG TPA: type II secretion system protein GspC [Povalibacter sp.]|uniref:type II secretion system protein GspC n=1 Tax=Povalibacter sp. TaxID=1962978 RepID=UPI002BA9061E|nr:type II secretion system protein GspC [Povalibacter sp.]HMN46666.1 type II secretion system protein GspC [Povalibacter sp.]